jgi:hypothetical protein
MRRRFLVGAAAAAASAWMAAASAPAPAARIADLAWLSGSWAGEDGDLEMEEHWTAPKGGSMLGLHRDVAGGRTVLFEFLRIEEGPDGIVYLASPRGRPPTPFRLTEAGPRSAVFENPEHDFPRRIRYWIEPDGSLAARVEGKEGGSEAPQEWRWRPSSLR